MVYVFLNPQARSLLQRAGINTEGLVADEPAFSSHTESEYDTRIYAYARSHVLYTHTH